MRKALRRDTAPRSEDSGAKVLQCPEVQGQSRCNAHRMFAHPLQVRPVSRFPCSISKPPISRHRMQSVASDMPSAGPFSSIFFPDRTAPPPVPTGDSSARHFAFLSPRVYSSRCWPKSETCLRGRLPGCGSRPVSANPAAFNPGRPSRLGVAVHSARQGRSGQAQIRDAVRAVDGNYRDLL